MNGPRIKGLGVALGVALGCAGPGCGGQKPARSGGQTLPGAAARDAERPVVRGIRVDGNRALTDDAIRAGLRHQRNSRLDPVVLRRDERRVEAFYRQNGYFSARAEGLIEPRDGGVVIIMSVSEGAPTRIVSSVVRGVPAGAGIDPAALLRSAGAELGRVFVHDDYVLVKERLGAALAEAGYVRAEVAGAVTVDRDARTAAIELAVAPGRRYRFGGTAVAGNDRIPASAILARRAWRRGDLYTPTALAETRQRLLGLRMFSAALIDPRLNDAEGVADVTIRVIESKPRALKLGGGFEFQGVGVRALDVDDTRLELHALADLTVRSWLDPLATWRVAVRPGYLLLPGRDEARSVVFEGRTEVTRPEVGRLRLDLGAFAAYVVETTEAFDTYGPRAGVMLSRSLLSNRLIVSAGARAANLAVSPVPETGLPDHTARVVMVEQSVEIDRRDNRVQPRSGWMARLALAEGLAAAAEPAGVLLLASTELRGYLGLGPRAVLAARGRAAVIRATRGEPPITERWFAGGASSHRGFGNRRLAPAVQAGAVGPDGEDRPRTVPIGGDALAIANVELRARAFRIARQWLGVVLFIDAGDVTGSLSELRTPHVAAGMGLRYETAVGPVRLDVAARLNRRDAREPDGRVNPDPGRDVALHLSLGEAF